MDRQQADLEKRIRKEEILEDKTLEKKEAARQRMLEHRARVQRLRQILEFSRSWLMAKTYKEIVM